ncbi:MAG: GIY-YIG nuclease family protein [Methylophilaceae bacterium]|nr:GIY-YIG nuclease family protein [Methylophilaceae bacterium]
MQPCVYILASERNGTLYIGVTSDLVKRVWQHQHGVADGFTKNIVCIIWFGTKLIRPWNLRYCVRKH